MISQFTFQAIVLTFLPKPRNHKKIILYWYYFIAPSRTTQLFLLCCSLAIKRFNLTGAEENLNQQPIVDCVIVFDQLFPSSSECTAPSLYNNLHLPLRRKPNYMQANLNVIRRVFSAGQQ